MADVFRVSLNQRFVVFVGAFILLYPIGLGIYHLFFHPLAKFPGPRLAAVTRWYEAYYDVIKGGVFVFKIGELHRKYGRNNFPSPCYT